MGRVKLDANVEHLEGPAAYTEGELEVADSGVSRWGETKAAIWVFHGMETGQQQKGGGLLAGSSIVVSSGRGCVGFMAKRSVREQEKHMEGLERR